MPEAQWISWMPSWAHTARFARFDIAHPTGEDAGWRCLRPQDEGWAELGDGLRKAQRSLAAMPIARIIEALDTVTRLWLDRGFEPRQRARAQVVLATGFSPEAVDRAFDVELQNYRAASLRRTLERELGGADVLDAFQPDRALPGYTRALGPRITLAVLTGNVPGLPALSIVRALLVKSAVIAKVASGEPTFAAAFARTLHEVEPALGDAIAITYWGRDDTSALRAALAQADAVIAYGSDEACASIRAHVGPRQRYVEHGHKFSAGIVSRSYLNERGATDVAEHIAADVSLFNQHACIAPQVYLIEGTREQVRAFGAEVANAFSSYAAQCPLGTLPQPEAASLQMFRAAAAWTASESAGQGFWPAPGLDWTVVLEDAVVSPSGLGNRWLRLVPVEGLEQAIGMLAPISTYLQNVGLGTAPDEFWPVAEELGRLGAARISEPGRMGEPSLMWRHDGELCIAQLVRWCDVEMHREAELPGQPADPRA